MADPSSIEQASNHAPAAPDTARAAAWLEAFAEPIRTDRHDVTRVVLLDCDATDRAVTDRDVT